MPLSSITVSAGEGLGMAVAVAVSIGMGVTLDDSVGVVLWEASGEGDSVPFTVVLTVTSLISTLQPVSSTTAPNIPSAKLLRWFRKLKAFKGLEDSLRIAISSNYTPNCQICQFCARKILSAAFQ